VNAFNPHEDGHAESLAILAAIQEHGDPLIVPTLLLPEVASAVANQVSSPSSESLPESPRESKALDPRLR